MPEEHMHRDIAQTRVQVILINGKKMDIPILTVQLAYPARCMRAAAKGDKKDPQRFRVTSSCGNFRHSRRVSNSILASEGPPPHVLDRLFESYLRMPAQLALRQPGVGDLN